MVWRLNPPVRRLSPATSPALLLLHHPEHRCTCARSRARPAKAPGTLLARAESSRQCGCCSSGDRSGTQVHFRPTPGAAIHDDLRNLAQEDRGRRRRAARGVGASCRQDRRRLRLRLSQRVADERARGDLWTSRSSAKPSSRMLSSALGHVRGRVAARDQSQSVTREREFGRKAGGRRDRSSSACSPTRSCS